MKRIVLFITSLAVLSARKLRHEDDYWDSVEDNSVSAEDRNWIETFYRGTVPFNLNGTLRQSFALHAALADPSRNLICSPLSALLPLGKLVLGTSRGVSRSELLNAIGYRKIKVKRRLRAIIKTLNYLPGVTLSIASTLFVSKNVKLIRKYSDDTHSVFKSSVQKVDFHKPKAAAAHINNMVYENTKGRISEILTPADISADTSLVIVNAIYFLGHWKFPFKEVTVDSFHSPYGERKLPMMRRVGNYKYTKNTVLDAQIIELPYEGENASFVIVLPVAQKGLTLLLRQLKLAPGLLNDAISKMNMLRVNLTIPKFRIETSLDLQALYEKIGVKHIFSNRNSGLSQIVHNQTVMVSKAVQKCFIEVNEKGSEAAAASAIHMVAESLLEEDDFKADHPFLFYIKRDEEQLFAGIFTND